MSSTRIRLLLSDVDGTLVKMDKTLTERSIEAVRALHDAGIHFAVTSGRPPRGMSMLVEPLALKTPLAAFNGGLVVEPDMDVVEQHVVPDELVAPTIELLERHWRVRHDTVDKAGLITLRWAGQLRHLAIGRAHTGTPVLLLVAGDDTLVINHTTGEIIAEHHLGENRDYQPKKQQSPSRRRG